MDKSKRGRTNDLATSLKNINTEACLYEKPEDHQATCWVKHYTPTIQNNQVKIIEGLL